MLYPKCLIILLGDRTQPLRFRVFMDILQLLTNSVPELSETVCGHASSTDSQRDIIKSALIGVHGLSGLLRIAGLNVVRWPSAALCCHMISRARFSNIDYMVSRQPPNRASAVCCVRSHIKWCASSFLLVALPCFHTPLG